MQGWIGTVALLIMFVAGVFGTIAAEAVKRRFPNSAYAKQSELASGGFIMLAVFSAFALFR
jgi:hypothetical protein